MISSGASYALNYAEHVNLKIQDSIFSNTLEQVERCYQDFQCSPEAISAMNRAIRHYVFLEMKQYLCDESVIYLKTALSYCGKKVPLSDHMRFYAQMENKRPQLKKRHSSEPHSSRHVPLSRR